MGLTKINFNSCLHNDRLPVVHSNYKSWSLPLSQCRSIERLYVRVVIFIYLLS
jgi:hypothetical protein